MSPELICVNPEKIEEVLPQIDPLLTRALSRGGEVTKERTLSELRAGTFLLWLAVSGRVEALAVTQLSAEEKICIIVLCAGEGRERWLHLLKQIEDYARSEGCEAIRIYGRNGWTRVLRGYRQTRVILEKEL